MLYLEHDRREVLYLGPIIRGLLKKLDMDLIEWLKLEKKEQLRAFQEEMFRTDKKNRKYNYKLNIMMDSGNKKWYEPMSYFGFSFNYTLLRPMDKLTTESEYEFRVSILQQLFFEIIYPRFKNDIRFVTVTFGNVYRYENGSYKLVFEEPKLHVIFESVVDDYMCKEINQLFHQYLEQLGYVDEVQRST